MRSSHILVFEIRIIISYLVSSMVKLVQTDSISKKRILKIYSNLHHTKRNDIYLPSNEILDYISLTSFLSRCNGIYCYKSNFRLQTISKRCKNYSVDIKEKHGDTKFNFFVM